MTGKVSRILWLIEAKVPAHPYGRKAVLQRRAAAKDAIDYQSI